MLADSRRGDHTDGRTITRCSRAFLQLYPQLVCHTHASFFFIYKKFFTKIAVWFLTWHNSIRERARGFVVSCLVLHLPVLKTLLQLLLCGPTRWRQGLVRAPWQIPFPGKARVVEFEAKRLFQRSKYWTTHILLHFKLRNQCVLFTDLCLN